MRIVHFLLGRCNPDSANGVDKAVYYLSKHQAALGHDLAVFSLTYKPALPIPGVIVRTYTPRKFPFALPEGLLKDLLGWNPDVVHLHSVYIPQNVALARWLREKQIPYVVTPHGALSSHVTRRRWYIKVPYKYLFELPLLNGASFVHAVADKKDIRNYGVRAPIVEAPNCIEIGELPTSVDKDVLLKHVPQAQGKRVFLFLGRLDPLHKGLDLLLKAFAKVRSDGDLLVLFGPDWKGHKSALLHLISDLEINERVFLPGPVYGQEKFHILGSADIFVHTSRWEAGLPFAVLEAMAMGRPFLLTTPADPMGKVTEHGVGIVVEPTVEDVADGLERIAEMTDDELKTMGEGARLLVETQFNWTETARKLVEAYSQYSVRA